MNNKINVSVIITVFNRQKLFKRALESLLNQSYTEFECIIVDDGSTDQIESIIAKLITFDYRFTYVKHSNRKTVKSLNRGIKLCSEEFITFLDSDDEYEKHHLEERINFFKNNKNIDLIYSPAELIGNEKDFYVPDAKNKNKLIHLNDCIIGATIFARKNVFEKLEGFREVYSYDSDFVKRAKNNKFVVKVFDKKTYIYHRDTSDSYLTLKKRKHGL